MLLFYYTDALIQSSDYVICLDSLAAAARSHDRSHDPPPSLAAHVSKPPKEGSKAAAMLDLLNKVTIADIANPLSYTFVNVYILYKERLILPS